MTLDEAAKRFPVGMSVYWRPAVGGPLEKTPRKVAGPPFASQYRGYTQVPLEGKLDGVSPYHLEPDTGAPPPPEQWSL